MKENEFWLIIDELNWSQSKDYNKNQLRLMKKYSKDTLEEFYDKYSKFENKIYKELMKFHDDEVREDKDGISIGDDSFGDLCSEIIGRGEHFYYETLSNPKKAQVMADNNDYKEKFSYSFPHDADFNYLDKNFYYSEIRRIMDRTGDNFRDNKEDDLLLFLKETYYNLMNNVVLNKIELNDPNFILSYNQILEHLKLNITSNRSYFMKYKAMRINELLDTYKFLFENR